jgi:hypothetical protein
MHELPNFNPENIEYPADVRLFHQKAGAAQKALFAKIAEAESEWMDQTMRAIMPSKLYDMQVSKVSQRTLRRMFDRWTDKHKVRIENQPDGTKRLMMGDRIAGEFRVTFEGGKVNITSKTIPRPGSSNQDPAQPEGGNGG